MNDGKRGPKQCGRFIEGENSNEVDRLTEGELDVMMDFFYEIYESSVLNILLSELTLAAKILELKRFFDSIDYYEDPEELIKLLIETYKEIHDSPKLFTVKEMFELAEVFAAKIQTIAIDLERIEWIDHFNKRFSRVIN
jgi:hypothetical protein